MEYGAKTTIFEYKIWLWCCAKLHAFSVKLYRIHIWKKIVIFPVAKKLFRTSHWRQSKVLLCVLYYCVSLSLRKRHTVFVDSVEHSLSVWDSVKGTKKCFCFLLDPEKEGVWYRRYSCFSCSKCKELEFLDCTNKSAGKWAFKKFKIQSSILFKLFDPILGSLKWFIGKASQKMRKRCVLRKAKLLRSLLLLILEVLKSD